MTTTGRYTTTAQLADLLTGLGWVPDPETPNAWRRGRRAAILAPALHTAEIWNTRTYAQEIVTWTPADSPTDIARDIHDAADALR